MNWLKSCVAAFRFLTIIPLPTSFGCAAEDLDDSPLFFPIVGAVLGLAAGAGAMLLWNILPPFAAATALTILLFLFSGALHLDGLADTADGFFSARTRDKMLAIMRDSRVGVMGVVALVSILLLKVSCLSALDGTEAARTSFLMVLTGRCAMVAMMVVLPYVRAEGGLGTRFYLRTTAWSGLISVTVLFIMFYLLAGMPGLAAAGFALSVLLLFCLFCYRRIGGATGDTLGAACEISEASVAFIFAVIISR